MVSFVHFVGLVTPLLSAMIFSVTAVLSSDHRDLIIRGEDAPPKEFEFMVALLNFADNKYQCGGTLIAPDIVLTAAHCLEFFDQVQIGRYNIHDDAEIYEAFIPQSKVHHPRYYSHSKADDDPYDFALVKLYGSTTRYKPVQLNRNVSVPSQPNQQLLVLGWGAQDPLNSKIVASTLQQATVDYIPNEQCKQIVGPINNGRIETLAAHIVSVSLCAIDFQEGQDSCNGDSGGPILATVENQLVQVGITSYGVSGCADDIFPGIYARVAEAQNWIEQEVCRLSIDPPVDFDCTEIESKLTKEATPAFTQKDLVTVKTEIKLDKDPGDTGWVIQSINEDGFRVTFAERPIFSYAEKEPFLVITEEFQLPNNRKYIIILLDRLGNGMCCDNKTGAGGALQIWAGEKRLLSRQYLTFNGSMSLIFTVGVLATPSPSGSIAPTSTSWPTSQPTHSRPIVSIEIQFDRHPTEVAWFLTTEDETEILDGRYPGAYDDSLRSGRIVESAFLRPTQGETTYTFVLVDNERDGLCCSGGTGFVRLWLGGVQEGTLLQEFSKYYIETRFTFTVDPTKTSAPTSAPTIRNMTLPGPNATSMAKPKVILETAMLLLTALLMMGLL